MLGMRADQLTPETQGPRAKYMLYPYYVLLTSTTAGTITTQFLRSSAVHPLTQSSDYVHDVPQGSGPQHLVLDSSLPERNYLGWSDSRSRMEEVE